jgi:phospholipid/cholesterol/gamma-HCH transport system substrate-binding protein/paraquat-inducible protein B
MSTKAHYFKIGVFVIAATTILVLGIVVLGAGKLFRKKIMLETYIDESVQGLDVGSPVKYRGVTIGAVEDITFVTEEYELDPTDPDFFQYSRYVLVKIAFYPDVLKGQRPEEIRQLVENSIAAGLTVRLASQGLTGTAYLEAQYVEPEKFLPPKIAWEPKTIYIPSSPSTFTRVTQSVERVLDKLEEAQVGELIQDTRRTIQNVDKFVGRLNAQIVPATGVVLKQAEETLSTYEGIAAEGSPTRVELVNALREAAAAARSLRALVDYLERHPEAVIQGKGGPGRNQGK